MTRPENPAKAAEAPQDFARQGPSLGGPGLGEAVPSVSLQTPIAPMLPRILLALLLVLNLLVQVERARAVFSHHDLLITEGGEGPVVFGIWKVQHGRPLYEDPRYPPFSLTVYNYLFYHLYAWLLNVAGIGDEAILWGGRILTLGWTIVLCGIALACMRRCLRRFGHSPPGAVEVVATLCVLGGTSFAGWWPLSIRPDLPALAFAAAGLWAVLRSIDEDSAGWSLAASMAFGCAWAVKQSIVLIYLAAVIHVAAARRSARHLLGLLAPAGLLMLASLAFGGDAYWHSVIGAAALGGFSGSQLLSFAARAVLPNSWLFALALAWACQGDRSPAPASGAAPGAPAPDACHRAARQVRTLLLIGLVLTLLLAAPAAARAGANKNAWFEGMVFVLLTASLGARSIGCWQGETRDEVIPAPAPRPAPPASPCLPYPSCSRWWATGLLAAAVAFPALQWSGAFEGRLGVIRLATPDELRQRAALKQAFRGFPKPVLTSDEIMALPWNAGLATEPAPVLDVYWFAKAVAARVITEARLQTYLGSGPINAVVARPASHLHDAARTAGFRPVEEIPDGRIGTLTVLLR